MEECIVYRQLSSGEIGVVVAAKESGASLEDVIAKDIPKGVEYIIIRTTDVPPDVFFGSWDISLRDNKIIVDLNKAKILAHERRRKKRAEEFLPLDDAIAKRIPGVEFDAVEAERQKIRDRYLLIQNNLDETNTVNDLYAVMTEARLI